MGLFLDQLDTFYLNTTWMRDSGYIRSIVVYLKQGSAHQVIPDAYYTRATVVHLFRWDIRNEKDSQCQLGTACCCTNVLSATLAVLLGAAKAFLLLAPSQRTVEYS